MPDPRKESLDEIVSHSATVLADQIQKAAAWAKSEMDLQVEVAGALKDFARRAQITLEGHHNVTIATGRPDSVYGSVIVEYKDPNTLSPTKDAAPNQRLIEQLKKRFYDMRREEKRQWPSMFGVGTDGKYFVFLRFRDEKWTDQEPLEVNRYSTERFLWALYNLGQKGKPYQPEYLHGDFGSDSRIAQEGVGTLYDEILKTENPRAQVFFSQWKILFGEVCGYDVENLTDKLKKLAEFYGVKGKPHPAHLLFALHTYFAVLIKLLAAEVVSFFNPWMPRQVEKLQNATTSAKLRRELEQLERGGIFHDMGITNFLEGDLFSWYLAEWSEPIEQLARKMIAKLDEYNPGTFSEDPAQSRDLLKKLYQQLFPKSVRHDLGEYYTPDWLAEHVLNELGYEGDPDKRLLDPACGSGTFLVMAINRIRRWYDANRERCAYDEGELLKKILTNVIGFDLNPLAVMAARTNYLVAVKDLIRHVDKVEIPIYLCDSVLTPAQTGSREKQMSFLTESGVHFDPSRPPMAVKTAAGIFLVPAEIATKRQLIGRYAEAVDFCIRNKYSVNDFITRCKEEDLPVVDDHLHRKFYSALVQLDANNRNGIWARIIKNAFAPLFTGLVDFVAGNPPWVNWESLPTDYRESSVELWDKYRLRERAVRGARLGNVKRELSALFLYVSIDHYLSNGGQLGFLITQSVFKTGANEGFRRFSCGPKSPFRILRVSDLSLSLPFENAVNRTAIAIARKGETTEYPVHYRLWVPLASRSIEIDSSLNDVQSKFRIRNWLAEPVEPSVRESTWLTASDKAFPIIRKILGDRSEEIMNRTYAGTCTWLNGVFWVESIKPSTRRTVIRNLGNIGKTKLQSVTATVESDFLFPLLRGRDVHAWYAKPSALILLPHRADDFGEPVGLHDLKKYYPSTFEYFRRFEEDLQKRSGYKQLHSSRPEFYVVGNTGDYTLSPYKVIFKELTDIFQCAVVGPTKTDAGSVRPTVPDHKLLFITCESEDEAYFLAGIFNSIPSRAALYSASVGVQTQSYYPTDLARLKFPKFDQKNDIHRTIARISSECHQCATVEPGHAIPGELETKLAECVAPLWHISRTENQRLLHYYNEVQYLRKRATRRIEENSDQA